MEPNTCVNCGIATPEAMSYCSLCAVDVRVELKIGLAQLARYLGVWPQLDRPFSDDPD
jgi:hypothetical protein